MLQLAKMEDKVESGGGRVGWGVGGVVESRGTGSRDQAMGTFEAGVMCLAVSMADGELGKLAGKQMMIQRETKYEHEERQSTQRD